LNLKLQGLAFRNVLPRPLGRTRAPSVLASGSQEREPGICHRRYQVFSTHANYRSALCGGKCHNTSPPRIFHLPLQPQRRNDQTSDNLRGSSYAQVGRQTPRLDAELGCGQCVLSRPDPPQASQVLLQPLGAAALCQEQVYSNQEVTLSAQDQTSRHRCPRLKRLCTCTTLSSSRRIFP
jgi:hypothetical protein